MDRGNSGLTEKSIEAIRSGSQLRSFGTFDPGGASIKSGLGGLFVRPATAAARRLLKWWQGA
jgi:hypothetical protein